MFGRRRIRVSWSESGLFRSGGRRQRARMGYSDEESAPQVSPLTSPGSLLPAISRSGDCASDRDKGRPRMGHYECSARAHGRARAPEDDRCTARRFQEEGRTRRTTVAGHAQVYSSQVTQRHIHLSLSLFSLPGVRRSRRLVRRRSAYFSHCGAVALCTEPAVAWDTWRAKLLCIFVAFSEVGCRGM